MGRSARRVLYIDPIYARDGVRCDDQEVPYLFTSSGATVDVRVGLLGVLLVNGTTVALAEIDADAAESLARKNKCFTCHAVDKKKDAPSYKDIATKYKGKPDAEQKLYTHLTTNPKVKVDGKEEEHPTPKTKNETDIRNLARWILSR